MAKGVFTRLKRFTLVEKTASDVGAGKAECLLVTRDQLAEIYYRAKDAVFSGSVTAVYPFTTISVVADSATAPPSDFHSGSSSDVICQRSYVDTQSPPVNTVDEPKIWTEAHEVPAPPLGSILVIPQVHGIVTGLTHYLETFVLPSVPSTQYYAKSVEGGGESLAAIELAFSDVVAWVDVTGSGNPYDSGNQLWVGLGFGCNTSPAGIAIVDAYTLATGNPNEGESGDLTIVLSSGSITCRLYASNFAFLTSAYSDLTLTVTEWWPYAKGDPATPVWDSTDGTKL